MTLAEKLSVTAVAVAALTLVPVAYVAYRMYTTGTTGLAGAKGSPPYGGGSPIVVVGGSMKAIAPGGWTCANNSCTSTLIDASVLSLDHVYKPTDDMGHPITDAPFSWEAIGDPWTINLHSYDADGGTHGLTLSSSGGKSAKITLGVLNQSNDDVVEDSPVLDDQTDKSHARQVYRRAKNCNANQRLCESIGTIDVIINNSKRSFSCKNGECIIYIGQ